MVLNCFCGNGGFFSSERDLVQAIFKTFPQRKGGSKDSEMSIHVDQLELILLKGNRNSCKRIDAYAHYGFTQFQLHDETMKSINKVLWAEIPS